MQFSDYLLEQTGADSEQVDDLRAMAQRGGRSLSDQAYLSGLLDEDGVLRAMSLAGCSATVRLSRRKIDLSALRLISGRQAWNSKLLPFAFDRGKRVLSLACVDPNDSELIETVATLFPEYTIKLHAAVGPVLEAAIIEHYRSEPLTGDDNESQLPVAGGQDASETYSGVVYLIGAMTRADRYLGETLASDGYQVFLANDWSDLTEELDNNPPDLVLIRESDDEVSHTEPASAIPQERLTSATIRRYHSVSELLDPSRDISEHSSLAVANLHLATEALARTLGDEIEMPVQIGALVEKVCQQLRLAPHDHLMTVTTAYLQDIAALHFKGEGPSDRATTYFMLQGLIDESEVFPPAVLGVIRKMYCDLTQMKPNEATSAETRNGNILTAVDYYIRQFPDQAKITPSRFDLIDQKIRDQVGRLLLPAVAEALLSIMSSEVTHLGGAESISRALVLDGLGVIDDGLAEIITGSRFALSLTGSVEQFVAQYQKRSPDLVIITSGSTFSEIDAIVQKLISEGVVFSGVPSFLIHSSTEFDKIARLAQFGLGHSIHYSGDFKILKCRFNQLADDHEQESRKRLQVLQDMGTHGSLGDMNIIDLLQSLGPSNKTLCMNVSGKGHHLTMYLNQGQLIHAASDDQDGVEAVYEALNWDNGIWSVEHVAAGDIPESNIQQSIDSILMQGCFLLDEMSRDQSLSQQINTQA